MERIFRKLPFFQDLDEDDLTALAPLATVQYFPAGEMIVEDGKENTTLYAVVEGRVAVIYPPDGIRDPDTVLLEENAIFGEMSFIDGSPAWHSVRAQTAVRAIALPHEMLQSLLADRPDLGARLLLRIARLLCTRLRSTERHYHLTRHLEDFDPT